MSKCPGYEAAFTPVRNHPPLNPVADGRREKSAEEFSADVKAFALAHEADDVGISPMNPLYVFEGYRIDEPWVIILALAHNYERLRQVPSDETNGEGICDVGDQYARGTRSSFSLANWIRSQGYNARGEIKAYSPTYPDEEGFSIAWETEAVPPIATVELYNKMLLTEQSNRS
jgi:epoxyqueuosine reductase